MEVGRKEPGFRPGGCSEEPLEVRVNGKSVSVMMRTPGHDKELAAGFLYTEGLIKSPKDITDIVGCENPKSEFDENVINVFLTPLRCVSDPGKLTPPFLRFLQLWWNRQGQPGGYPSKFQTCEIHLPPLCKVLSSLPEKPALKTGNLLEKTGGLHASASCLIPRGRLVVLTGGCGAA